MVGCFRLRQVIHAALLILSSLLVCTTTVLGQVELPAYDPSLDPTPEDSIYTTSDSLYRDSVLTVRDAPLQTKVDYDARDSIIIDVKQQKAFLYGEAIVNYEDIELTAGYIEIDFTKNLVYASGIEDTAGKMIEEPLFKEAGKEYKAGEMTYNFQSKKGKIVEAFTQEGEGYVHGERIKKYSDDVFYIKNGKYTTCNLDHPHFYILASKLKIINNQKIVTGPANMWIADVPTPLAVPFGFFPNKRERQSGILIPTYGNSPGKGFFLQNGGFYWGASDNFDTEIRGDIYTNTSWAVNTSSRYKKRYKHQGNLDFQYVNNKDGDPETPDYSEVTSFFVRWNHKQDPKARPYSSFNASVNAGSVNNFQNNFNIDPTNYLNNTFKSNISYTKRFANTPFTLTANGSHTQNSQDSTISITLPQVAFTMNRIFPFKRKVRFGKEKFYEKIGVSLTSNFQNRVTTKQEDLFTESTLDKLQYGMQHRIPISTNVKLGHFNISPNVNITETWYGKTNRASYDEDTKGLVYDTVVGFERFAQINTGIGISTKLYGMYTYKKGRIKAIRHTFTPNINFSYTPDYSTIDPDAFVEVQTDSLGTVEKRSIFTGGIFGAPTTYRQALVNFNFQNSFEMKVAPGKNDTAETLRKVKLLDALNFSTTYDIYKDSLNWDPLRISARTSLGKILSVQGNATFDPYTINEIGRRINTAQYEVNGKLARLTAVDFTFNMNLQSDPKDPEKKDTRAPNASQGELDEIRQDPKAYIDFNIPWRLGVNYNVGYRKPGLEESVVNTIGLNGDVSITENWKMAFRTGYDFENQAASITSIDVIRDLHCWQIRFSTIPFSNNPNQNYTQYSFDINVKASVLQDLKLSRRRSYFDQ
jgi:lipopolysaccharide assembly outer membrane protein LptD (OstA)